MPLRIIYLGTPDFAVAPLDTLVQNDCNIVAVITAPDKPSGRGLQMNEPAVKKFAVAHNIPVLQPTNLKDPAFLEDVRSYNADLQIVVAFRMMPEALWNMPRLGTFNLHASLLPQYRGAAPINHAVINGEKETGVTTFFLKHIIDTGDIIFREKVAIGPNETAGELHDKLMHVGAALVLKTVQSIEANNVQPIPQDNIPESELKSAPKIFRDFCRVNWLLTAEQVHNHVRGLSPYPAAYSVLKNTDGKEQEVKLLRTAVSTQPHNKAIGTVESDNKSYLRVYLAGGSIDILELQPATKRRMKISEFLAGNKIGDTTQFI